jgi:hypothetical protein
MAAGEMNSFAPDYGMARTAASRLLYLIAQQPELNSKENYSYCPVEGPFTQFTLIACYIIAISSFLLVIVLGMPHDVHSTRTIDNKGLRSTKPCSISLKLFLDTCRQHLLLLSSCSSSVP